MIEVPGLMQVYINYDSRLMDLRSSGLDQLCSAAQDQRQTIVLFTILLISIASKN